MPCVVQLFKDSIFMSMDTCLRLIGAKDRSGDPMVVASDAVWDALNDHALSLA